MQLPLFVSAVLIKLSHWPSQLPALGREFNENSGAVTLASVMALAAVWARCTTVSCEAKFTVPAGNDDSDSDFCEPTCK